MRRKGCLLRRREGEEPRVCRHMSQKTRLRPLGNFPWMGRGIPWNAKSMGCLCRVVAYEERERPLRLLDCPLRRVVFRGRFNVLPNGAHSPPPFRLPSARCGSGKGLFPFSLSARSAFLYRLFMNRVGASAKKLRQVCFLRLPFTTFAAAIKPRNVRTM